MQRPAALRQWAQPGQPPPAVRQVAAERGKSEKPAPAAVGGGEIRGELEYDRHATPAKGILRRRLNQV